MKKKFKGNCGAICFIDDNDDDYFVAIKVNCPKCNKVHEYKKESSPSDN
jgi:hypothetical protein